MKRVLCWLCFVIALALLPQTALARAFYLSYNVGDGWKWCTVQFTNQGGTTWKAELPAGDGVDGEYRIRISSEYFSEEFDGKHYHNDGNYNLDVTSASENSKKYLYPYGTGKEYLIIKNVTGKPLTLYVQEDGNNCNFWYKESTPLYISYRMDGGNWTWSVPMNASGSDFTYRLPEACASNVEFAITRTQVNSESGLTSDNAKTQYTLSGSTYDDTNPCKVSSGVDLQVYGTCKHWLKVEGAGIYTFTMSAASGDSEGFPNKKLTYTRIDGGHEPSPESGYYFGFRNTGSNWAWGRNVTDLGNNQYKFSFNNPGSGADGYDDVMFYISKEKAEWPTRFNFENSNNNSEIKSFPATLKYSSANNLILPNVGRCNVTVYFTRIDDNTIQITSYETGEIVIPSFSGHFYYGWHGDNAKWVHVAEELLPDADGVYKLPTIDNKMNQNQYFYITDCAVGSEFRLSNGFPLHRYVDNDDVFDYPVAETGNPDFGRHNTRTVLYVPDSKNHEINISFTKNADGTINVISKKTAHETVVDERTKTNLPLRQRDFFVNGDESKPRPHYFLVGTRMADWKLQPEWEMTQTGANTYEITTPRVMYTGLVSVAKVSRYDNYANNRYYRFATEAGGFEFKPGAASATLVERGPYAFYRDLAPTSTQADRFLSSDSKNYDYANIEQDLGVVVSKIIVTTNEKGDPINLEFVYSDEPVANYLTFSLVGGKIVNQGLPESTMTQASLILDNKPTDTWQDAWVQYDPETGVPYRDASGMLIYQTVFQSDWLDKHPTYFNRQLPDGSQFNYTSQSIVLRHSSLLDEDEEEDPYTPYYNRFTNAANQTIGGTNKQVSINDDIQFKETLKFHNEKAEDKEFEREAKSQAGWQCFVVKDMWMDDFFKVWTGWGGGRKINEGSIDPNAGADKDNDRKASRWYYQNGGTEHANCHVYEKDADDNVISEHGCDGAVVNGYDIMSKNNNVNIYGTARDKNEADFHIKNLTYFKRVILWYDPAEGFNNSVIQFIIERCGPAIKATRGAKGNQIKYTWNIPNPENNLSEQERAFRVQSYTIERYKLDANGKFILHGKNPAQSVTGTFDKPVGTIANFMDKELTYTDDELTGGTYRYKVILTYFDNNNPDTPVTRDAWSNRVTLYDATMPVVGKTWQITEGEGNDLKYSFDLRLDLDISGPAAEALYGGHHVYELATDYYVSIDPEIMDDLNNATATIITTDGTSEPFTTKFEVREVKQYVNGAPVTTTDRAWIEVPFKEAHMAKTIVWENIVQKDPTKEYAFRLFLKRNEKYTDIFAAANFGRSECETEWVIPAVKVKYEGAEIVTDNGGDEPDADKLIFAGKNTPQAFMPMGSHHGADKLHAPVHYTQANRLDARFTVTEPAVTDKVKEKYDILYTASDEPLEEDADPKIVRAALPTVGDFSDIQALADQNGLDVELLWKQLDLDADGKTYYAIDPEKSIPVALNADVTYTRKDNPALGTMTPMAMSHADGEATLTLLAPEFEPQARAITNEQVATDGKRYFIHELQMNLSFTNLNTQDMVVRPGFHIKAAGPDRTAQFDNEAGNSADKAANGGIVAYKGVKHDSPDFYAHFEEYTPFDGTAYNNGLNNWSKFAVMSTNLPIYVDYFSAKEKTAESTDADWKEIPNVGGHVVYHYPFIVNRERPASASARALRAPLADNENNIKTLTTVGDGGQLEIEPSVMTAIETVEADLSDAEYFNLQGIRVTNPVPGQFYLVRRNGTVTKVLYR